MSTTLTASELQKYIDRVAERLPKRIIVAGKTLTLDIKCFVNGLDDFWTLSYRTKDPKDTFIHRYEATLETCVLGAWRSLALLKDEWQFEEEVMTKTIKKATVKRPLIELPCLFCEELTMFDRDDRTGLGRTCNKCKRKHML